MASIRRERRRAREGALALLYSGDITESNAASLVEEGAYPDDSLVVSEYAEKLVRGVTEHVQEIDAQLASTSENWALDRMPVVDRAILRIAVYEMLYVDEVPVSVAINEAVDLAKMYGGEDESSRFVNGVLGRIARKGELADETEAAEVPDEEAEAMAADQDDMPTEPVADGDSAESDLGGQLS